MKKRIILISAAVLFVVGGIWQVFNAHQNRIFRQKYGFSAILAVREAGNMIKTINFGTGSVSRYTHEEYSAASESSILIAINSEDKADVVLYENGERTLLFSTVQYIWGQPVMIEDKVYFIAAETNERWQQNSKISDAYLWVFENEKIEKFHDVNVGHFSGILNHGETIIFVEELSTTTNMAVTINGEKTDRFANIDDRQIIKKNVITHETEVIYEGQFPCWQEPGNTFFFAMPHKGLARYNLLTKTVEILDEYLFVESSPIYNSTNEILLFIYPDPDNLMSININTEGMFYLRHFEIIKCRKYFKQMGFGWEEDYHGIRNYLFWEE